MRILSIDDEMNFTDALKQYFEVRGYEIDVTSVGSEGVNLLKKNKYDVVLLDLKMRGMSGEDILNEMKRSGLRIKTIIITAYNDSGKTKERLLAEGAYAFLEKPISSLKDLEKCINGAVNGETWKEL